MNLQFSLRWMLVGVTLAAIAVASLVGPNMLWAGLWGTIAEILLIYGAIRARSVRPSRHFWFGFTITVFVYLLFSEPRIFNVAQLALSAGEMWAQWSASANAYERVAFHSTANILIALVAGFVGGLVGRRLADKDEHEVER